MTRAERDKAEIRKVLSEGSAVTIVDGKYASCAYGKNCDPELCPFTTHISCMDAVINYLMEEVPDEP